MLANLRNALLDSLFLALAVNNRCVVFVNHDARCLPQIIEVRALERLAHFFANHLAASECRDVAQHLLAAVAKAGRFDSGDIQHATQFIDNECRKRLALDVFGDNEQWLAAFHG